MGPQDQTKPPTPKKRTFMSIEGMEPSIKLPVYLQAYAHMAPKS